MTALPLTTRPFGFGRLHARLEFQLVSLSFRFRFACGLELIEHPADVLGDLLLLSFEFIPQDAPNRANCIAPKHCLFFSVVGHRRTTDMGADCRVTDLGATRSLAALQIGRGQPRLSGRPMGGATYKRLKLRPSEAHHIREDFLAECIEL
jgi:hypothetical protein